MGSEACEASPCFSLVFSGTEIDWNRWCEFLCKLYCFLRQQTEFFIKTKPVKNSSYIVGFFYQHSINRVLMLLFSDCLKHRMKGS